MSVPAVQVDPTATSQTPPAVPVATPPAPAPSSAPISTMSTSTRHPVDDVDDSFNYISVPVADVPDPTTETLQDTLQQVRIADVQNTAAELVEPIGSIEHPELVQDFIRNYLLKKGMSKTFNAFQTEWYEHTRGTKQQQHATETGQAVPDCYIENTRLEAEVERLKKEVQRKADEAARVVAVAASLKKERDFHRIAHRRVKEEKRDLLTSATRAEEKCQEMRDALDNMRIKYQKAVRQKTTADLSLERSQKEVDEMVALSKQVLDLSANGGGGGDNTGDATGDTMVVTSSSTPTALPEPQLPGGGNGGGGGGGGVGTSTYTTAPDATMPQTPHIAHRPTAPSSACREFAASALERRPPRLARTFRAHDDGVCALAVDATGTVVGTASDDGLFRTWQADGELLLEGAGHTAWLSACTFHPGGKPLAATSSGDTTVKLWDLDATRCAVTLSGHAYAVWDVSFHCSGDFLASSSLDNTVKLWDVTTAKCRRTLRGHTDAVNTIEFQPASNLAVSAGADRSCMVWDTRLGRAVSGLVGHRSAVFHATFSPDGAHSASVDANGVLKLWEMRTGTCLATTRVGTAGAPANRVAFDPTGMVLAVGSEDTTIRIFSAADPAAGHLCELAAHTDSVQGLAFNAASGSLVSGSADGTVRMWVHE